MGLRSFTSLMVALTLTSPHAAADTLGAARTIQATERLTEEHLQLASVNTPGAASRIDQVLGREARRTIFQGRPIFLSDVAAPALIERNQIVLLVFRAGGLSIETEGRAMERGASGDRIRVLNLSSRTTVLGRVDQFGAVNVGQR